MTLFSTASTTPSFVLTPTTVDPSCMQKVILRYWLSNLSGGHEHIVASIRSSDGRSSHLNGFDGVLYLNQPSLWAESIDSSVIFAPCEEHVSPVLKYLLSASPKSATLSIAHLESSIARLKRQTEILRADLRCRNAEMALLYRHSRERVS